MILLLIIGIICLAISWIPMAHPINLILRIIGIICVVVGLILLLLDLTDISVHTNHINGNKQIERLYK